MSVESFLNGIGIFGVMVFAVSGALAAARKNMDPIGFLLLGTITAIGGGTVRDIILDRPVFWRGDPSQLVIALVASLLTYVFVSIAADFERPMIFRGQLYAIAAMAGAITVVGLHDLGVSYSIVATAGAAIAFATWGAAMIFNIRSDPPSADHVESD